MDNELLLVTRLEKMGVAPTESKTLLSGFGDLFVQAHKLVAQSKAIKVTSEDQVEEMALAKKLRIKLMKVRTDAEKVKKAIKEPYLRGAQASQDIYNDIKKITKPEEERLMEQERFAELAEEKRVEERHTRRVTKLSLYVADVSVYDLKNIPDESFDMLVADCKKVYDDKIAAEKTAEKARLKEEADAEIYRDRKMVLAEYSSFIDISKLKADTSQTDYEAMIRTAKSLQKTSEDNLKQVRLENERLKKEADAKMATEAEETKRRADSDAKIRAENDEKIRLANVATEAAEKKLKEARELEDRKKLEETQRLENQKRLEEDEAKKKLLAPDKEKLISLARDIDLIVFPAVNSNEAGEAIKKANQMLDEVSKFLRERARSL